MINSIEPLKSLAHNAQFKWSICILIFKMMTFSSSFYTGTHVLMIFNSIHPNMFSLAYGILHFLINLIYMSYCMPTSRKCYAWLHLLVILELLKRSPKSCFNLLIWQNSFLTKLSFWTIVTFPAWKYIIPYVRQRNNVQFWVMTFKCEASAVLQFL